MAASILSTVTLKKWVLVGWSRSDFHVLKTFFCAPTTLLRNEFLYPSYLHWAMDQGIETLQLAWLLVHPLNLLGFGHWNDNIWFSSVDMQSNLHDCFFYSILSAMSSGILSEATATPSAKSVSVKVTASCLLFLRSWKVKLRFSWWSVVVRSSIYTERTKTK